VVVRYFDEPADAGEAPQQAPHLLLARAEHAGEVPYPRWLEACAFQDLLDTHP